MTRPCLPPAETLSEAARYAPYAKGRYDVRAGLAALGTDFGNGAADGQVFQLDEGFPAFRQNKLAARAERLSKYWRSSPGFADVAAPVCAALVRRLLAEHPEHFQADPPPAAWLPPPGDAPAHPACDLAEHAEHLGLAGPGAVDLTCRLTGEVLRLDAAWGLLKADPAPSPSPAYAYAFDALACQVAEDLAVIRRRPGGGDEVCAIHLCAANHWSAEDKVGGSFAEIHAPVPGMEPVTRKAGSMVDAMVDRGPFVRFVWGVATDTHLNHHPEPPPGVDPAAWHGRRFDPKHPRLWIRIERQIILGIPEADAALFAIRTSFRDGDALCADPAANAALQSALRSMTPAQAVYKGVSDSREAILAWLREGLAES